MFCLTKTMVLSTTMDWHDNTLPTPVPLPFAKASNSRQQHNIDMIQGVDWCDASIQHNALYGLCTHSNNIQLPIMKPPDQSKYQDYTGHHDDLQCPVADCRLTHTNNILQVTPMPNNAHADPLTPFSTKISEKITIPLPYYQSHHYTHAVINKKYGNPWKHHYCTSTTHPPLHSKWRHMTDKPSHNHHRICHSTPIWNCINHSHAQGKTNTTKEQPF